MDGRVAYVEQEPSIFAGTVRENILFGRPFDPELYSRVVEAACLDRDVESCVHGDKTEIGEKGVTMSGGQKARVNFGRALYSNADIYLLDDPLSAVDSKVSKDMFNIGIKEFLHGWSSYNKDILISINRLVHEYTCETITISLDGWNEIGLVTGTE